ncbi:NUDIX domain-containing protein [Natranaerovirga pectinivora]|uniref:NUDIX domain-containing protein n=1 Tax=Natranaerovirga pectinivora TaxID=682400 RepID=A0A4R3MMU3_9FIRM|nr:NUDIX domain-containing protein [Natranaerovirga pectinivora]TCT15613.1 NUDIX domain-containing protein [Natranaerovirga pectinivora]
MSEIFDIFIGTKENYNIPLIQREAVRGIILNNDKILMMVSSKNDHKLPGGGIESGETHYEALTREIKEETGFDCIGISKQVGKVFERKIDFFDSNYMFEMVSYYYICKLDKKKGKLELTESEKALGFKPVYIGIEEAIQANNEFILKYPEGVIWTKRENLVLEKILLNLDEIKNISVRL